MNATAPTASLRALARLRRTWRTGARGLADILPKGLYARSLLIVIVPMVLLQTAVAYVFMERHWELVTHRLSGAVARDVGAMVDLYSAIPPGGDDKRLRAIAGERFRMDVEVMPAGPLPPKMPRTFFTSLDPLTRALPEELAQQVRLPFWVDTVGRSGLMEIRVEFGDRVLRFVTRRSLAYEANVHIFILWMLGASIVLVTVAILFLRNQIRPILRLARAAEEFGKGRDVAFSPRGAREVRQAGAAFVEMKRRVERAIEQRTTMLNGVSHDLRTIITRFKLSLALMAPSNEAAEMRKDVEEMEHMVEAYLAFARGDGGETPVKTDIGAIIKDLQIDTQKMGIDARLALSGDPVVVARPASIKRLLANLVGNAQRYGKRIDFTAINDGKTMTIHIDDNGPGIPVDRLEDAFRPFYRLDESRNQDHGNSGLGLAIARDIARTHGGDLTLARSELGGLRATVTLPV